MTEHTAPDEGRRRIQEQDRRDDGANDVLPGGVDPNDAAVRRRAENANEQADGSDREPGVTPNSEQWERERRMHGGDPNVPGRQGTEPEHQRPLSADEFPDQAETTQG